MQSVGSQLIVMSQKIELFTTTTVRTSGPTYCVMSIDIFYFIIIRVYVVNFSREQAGISIFQFS
jgi:hypothetical protein